MTNRNTIIEIAFSNHADAELMYDAIEQLVYDFGQLGTLSMREADPPWQPIETAPREEDA